MKGEREEILERGVAPSLTPTPPSLIKGRGQGDGLLNNFKSRKLTGRTAL
jgi:hypothetical protein